MRVKESQYLHEYCIENPIPILMNPGNLHCFMPHCSPRTGARTTLLIKQHEEKTRMSRVYTTRDVVESSTPFSVMLKGISRFGTWLFFTL